MKSHETFTITNNKFINNTFNSGYGGGIGMWIVNQDIDNSLKKLKNTHLQIAKSRLLELN